MTSSAVDRRDFLLGAAIVGAATLSAAAPPARAQVPVCAPPRPPGPYDLPARAVRVTDGAGLVAALAARRPADIVLAAGEYHAGKPFRNTRGHRLYAERTGAAVLRAGLVVGSNFGGAGAVVRGLAFSVPDRRLTLHNSLLLVWGKARDVQLLDLFLDGQMSTGTGVMVHQPEGAVLRRILARNFHSNGVRVRANRKARILERPVIVEDIDVAHVSRPVPMSSQGTAEAGIWIGETALAARLRMRDCAWMGLWTGGSTDGARFSDIDIDAIPRGSAIYAEHFTHNSVFERLCIGPNVRRGVTCEWADPRWGGLPACDNVVFQDGIIRTTCGGIYLAKGTRRTTVRRMRFEGQRAFAIGDHDGVGNLWDVTGNDYGGIAKTAVAVHDGHYRRLRKRFCR